MLDDAFDGVVGLHHFLVVAAALLMGTCAEIFAHDPVEVPFSAQFAFPLQDLLELQQEAEVLVVLGLGPVGGRIGFFAGRALRQAVQHLFGSEHPGFEFGEPGDCGRRAGVAVGVNGSCILTGIHQI
jgi:hypothetical protein